MHHILNVKQIFIKSKFIECDYYFVNYLRGAGSLVAEPKYGFFDKCCHGVCNSTPKSTVENNGGCTFCHTECMAYLDYQSRHKLISLQHLSLYYIHCVARFKALGSFLCIFHERLLGILTLRIIGNNDAYNLNSIVFNK